MAKRKASSEEQKRNFARFMFKTRTENVLRMISASFDWVSDEVGRGICVSEPDKALHRAFGRHNLEGYTINGRYMTYKQAQIIYEAVQGKYGSLLQKPVSKEPLTIFQDLKSTKRVTDGFCMDFFEHTPEQYLAEYERGLRSA
ncbi:MAG: hypothetical protein AABX17_00275 [Nanoarchaeota archaeon]